MIGEDQLRCTVGASSAGNPDGLQDWQLLVAQAARQEASLATAETPGSASFPDSLRPYLKPERVRDNKERQLGGRPVEFRQ